MALALARGRGRVRDVKVELHSRKTNKNLPRKDRKGTLVRVSYRGIRRFRNIVSEERVPCDPSRHSQRCICGPIGGKGWRPLVSLLGNASNAAGAPSTFPPAGWATHSLGEVIVLLVQDWREPRLRQHEEDHHDSRTPRVPDFDPAWKSAFFPPPPSSHRLGKKKIRPKIHSRGQAPVGPWGASSRARTTRSGRRGREGGSGRPIGHLDRSERSPPSDLRPPIERSSTTSALDGSR